MSSHLLRQSKKEPETYLRLITDLDSRRTLLPIPDIQLKVNQQAIVKTLTCARPLPALQTCPFRRENSCVAETLGAIPAKSLNQVFPLPSFLFVGGSALLTGSNLDLLWRGVEHTNPF